MKALELQKIYYKQGNFVLHNIHFSLEEGSCTALVGPSASGKTTLIRLIANVMRADVGKIFYFGKELFENEYEIRKSMSVMFHETNFNENMKTLMLAQELKRFEPEFDMQEFQRYMEYFGLSNNIKIKELSNGAKKKYMLILALCRQPKLLIMDEPTGGLDEQSRKQFWTLIEEYRKKTELTILFTSHQLDEVKMYATRQLTMERGGMRE